jgi:diguanylate cyclase (GGDEF)-like protein
MIAVRQQAATGAARDMRANTGIAFAALGAFVFGGSELAPHLAGLDMAGADPNLVGAFILNIALILFAWRRSVDLRQAVARQELAESRSHELAYTDEVTHLPNRRYFTEHLASLTNTDGSQHTLMLIDIDHFKKVNDLYGHAAGDQLLVQCARRIENATPAGARCARLGGDEFAILLEGDLALPAAATALAEQLLEEFGRPIQIDGTIASVGGSIGLSTHYDRCSDAGLLLRRSDIALYEAKKLGRGRIAWFSEAMELELARRNGVEADMRLGLSEGRFVPYFQPLIDIGSGELKGFEVLARWDHPIRGIVEPDEFISLAETIGLISDLSLGVMQSALVAARDWPSHLTIAVNISPVQFKDPILAQRILKLVNETGFPCHRLELEITECAILEDSEMALAAIISLKNQGIRISLDDFGTGYASLAQLRSLPFDRIKIDRTFIASLLGDEQSNAIVHSIVTLGKSLKLPITAEGIETSQIYARVRELGCTDAQGWLFGKAMSVRDVEGIIAGLRDTPAEAAVASGEEQRKAAAGPDISGSLRRA